jgi:hypothetical protein
LYDVEGEKMLYFEQSDVKQDSGKELKLKRIVKHIEKFINIYEDDLNEFYELFKILDSGGRIDLSGLENKAVMKCLKKLFKYLPLRKEEGEYKKMEQSAIALEHFMKQKVT